MNNNNETNLEEKSLPKPLTVGNGKIKEVRKSKRENGKTSPHLPGEAERDLPFETRELRKKLKEILDLPIKDGAADRLTEPKTIGNSKWGIYAFFDYDDEPIYVGQTNESLRIRIRRHLTNQRSDAVAMGVLDPHEVRSIQVWPIPEFQLISKKIDPIAYQDAKAKLNSLERAVYDHLYEASEHKAILNEKLPPPNLKNPTLPASHKEDLASVEVLKLRDHPDLRIARRAKTIAKLAQVISERKVTKGLRNVLVMQAKRLLILSQLRFDKAENISEKNAD